ncbi:hypothetical protein EKK58_00460 [Candidatus Dependentiae bacterium]|nr:MAG: hypothetical protein EKK58_00460 [Candidatus Dependentiae bacterium]
MPEENPVASIEIAATSEVPTPAVPEPSSPPTIPAVSVVTIPAEKMTEMEQRLARQEKLLQSLTKTVNNVSLLVAPTKGSKTAKAPIVPKVWTVVLRRGSSETRVVERNSRKSLRGGSSSNGASTWSTEAEAKTFWRGLPAVSEYKIRQEGEGWRVLYEPYNPKRHDKMSTQFRAKKPAVRAKSMTVLAAVEA